MVYKSYFFFYASCAVTLRRADNDTDTGNLVVLTLVSYTLFNPVDSVFCKDQSWINYRGTSYISSL